MTDTTTLDTQQTIDQEHDLLVQVYKRAPFVLERGEGAYLYDTEGREYLDMVGGVAVNALGYGDAGMEATMQRAASGLLHVSNLFHTAPQVELAQRLVGSSFADRVFFCNSGTEAIEGALKFARKWARTHSGNPDKYEIVAFTHSFHGRSMGALATTHTPKYREPFAPLIGGVHFAEYNDLESAKAIIGPNTAAVLVEPVQGEGGITPASETFLKGLRQLCDEYGAALIFDEIQCGMGRTGTLWAHEAAGVTPDIMTVAKPLGGGLPIGAILMTEEVGTTIVPGDHGSTFAGGPFITTVAAYVYDRIADPAFLDHVKEMGNYMGEQLSELAADLPVIKEIRGRGLMWGIELHDSLAAPDAVTAAYEHGLLLVGAGRNTLRLIPPLIIQRHHVDELTDKLRALLTPYA
jgi:acetylornithine/N-succinyldiaminopimelate aminotransferase